MKKLLFALCLATLCPCALSAADLTLYYSPTCPHCHHARDFINNELVYEYQGIKIDAYNVGMGDNMNAFKDALKKCKYESGGIPVIVVGDKCFQGYAEFMNSELRDAVSVGLSDADKKAAAANVKKFTADPVKFREANKGRANVMNERVIDASKKK